MNRRLVNVNCTTEKVGVSVSDNCPSPNPCPNSCLPKFKNVRKNSASDTDTSSCPKSCPPFSAVHWFTFFKKYSFIPNHTNIYCVRIYTSFSFCIMNILHLENDIQIKILINLMLVSSQIRNQKLKFLIIIILAEYIPSVQFRVNID